MSNATMQCTKCNAHWECDISEVLLDEYEFATGSKDCPKCVEITNTLDVQFEKLFNSTNSVLWGMTHTHAKHNRILSNVTKELMDEAESVIVKLRASLKRDIYMPNEVFYMVCDECFKHWEYVATPEEIEYGVSNDTMTCDACSSIK